MNRRKIAVMVSLALLAGASLAGPAPAAASCSQAKVTLYTDSGFNGDSLTICFGGDYSGVTSLPAWIDNKTSSVRFTNYMPYWYAVCLYDGTSYTGSKLLRLEAISGSTASYQWYGWDWQNDKASSARFLYYTHAC